MQYLAVLKLKPTSSRESVMAQMKPEAAIAWELLVAGTLRSIHLIQGQQGPAGAVLLLEAANEAEAADHVKKLPLVEHGLVAVELLPLTPFTGFAALFAHA